MRNISLLALSIILSLTSLSCDKNDALDEKISLIGTVTINGNQIEGVKVRLLGIDSYETVSDPQGDFRFESIKKGDYELKLFYIEDEQLKSLSIENESNVFVERSYELNITESTVLDQLVLPNPVKISTKLNDSRETAIITWNKTKAEDFREYKIYKHYSSGLDENSGQLVHVSTSRKDTTWLDKYHSTSGDDHYYRVYVMNEYGRLGGSNIAHVDRRINYEPSSYTLELVSSIGIPISNVEGITSDQDNIWLLSSSWNNSSARLVYYNLETYEITKDIWLNNLFEKLGTGISGLTWDGTHIWVSVSGQENKIAKVNPTTETIEKIWASPTLTAPTDLDWDGNDLWLMSGGNVYKIDRTTGSSTKIVDHKRRTDGMAVRNDEIWLGDMFLGAVANTQLHVYNKSTGERMGTIPNHFSRGKSFCFHKNKLAVIDQGNIKFYNILSN